MCLIICLDFSQYSGLRDEWQDHARNDRHDRCNETFQLTQEESARFAELVAKCINWLIGIKITTSTDRSKRRPNNANELKDGVKNDKIFELAERSGK